MFDLDNLIEWLLEKFEVTPGKSELTFTISKDKDFKDLTNWTLVITDDMASEEELRLCFVEQYVI